MSIFNWFKQKEFIYKEHLSSTFPTIEFEMCFKLNSLKVSDILSLVESPNIGYTLTRWIGGFGDMSLQEGIKKAMRINKHLFFEKCHLFYDDEMQNRLTICPSGPKELPGCDRIIWKGEKGKLDLTLFEPFFKLNGFVCAYSFWQFDEFIQNEVYLRNYELKGIPVNKKKIYTKDGDKCITIEGNPGRLRQVRNMVLRSCWRMWFSNNYFELIDKEKVEKFNYCNKNILIKNNVRFIELYPNPFESDNPENRIIQKEFNNLVGIEELHKACWDNYNPIGSLYDDSQDDDGKCWD